MQMYRRRPDVLAAALRDMGFSMTGDDIPDVDDLADGHDEEKQHNFSDN